MVRASLWNHDQVGMRHAVAVDEKPHPLRSKLGLQSTTDALGNDHDAGCELVGEISKLINVGLGNDEAFARRSGPDGHKRHDVCVFVDSARGSATRDDVTKGAIHGSIAQS